MAILQNLERKRMSGKVKSRGSTNSANTLEAATTTLNERILKVRENVEKKKKVSRSATHCHTLCRSATHCTLILSTG